MSVIRIPTLGLIHRLFNDLDRSFFTDERYLSPMYWQNVAEEFQQTPTGYSLEMAVPGFAKADLNVRVSDERMLTVSGHRAGNVRNSKLFQGWVLPQEADVSSIKAKLANGLLTITCERSKQETSDRQIVID
jgi:HSP20 family molecular chaperone IbpA